jgi:hypothetical protein
MPQTPDYTNSAQGIGVYASEQVGSPTAPGSSQHGPAFPAGRQQTRTGNGMIRVREMLAAYVFENWVPFTTAIRNRFQGPRAATQPWESPFDLSPSERITRFGTFPSGERPFPYPYEIGAVSGFMPMLDQYSMAWAIAKTPSGPGVLTPIPVPWDILYPSLAKVQG